MRRVFVGAVLGLLVAACAQDDQGEQQDLSSADGQEEAQGVGGRGEDGGGGGGDVPVPPAIDAEIFIETITCERTIARFEAGFSPGLNVACKWTFDDGATSDECAGEHEFAVAGFHDFVLEVTDLDTGATDIATQTRFFFPPLELTLEVTGNHEDLTITYFAMSNTGGEQVVFVTPDELVIADDPNYPATTSGTVRVLEAGTYTVTYLVEDERGVSEICNGELVKQVTLTCEGEKPVQWALDSRAR